MSRSIENLSRTIAGATDLEAVVRSMKALAASSIGQYEKAVHSLDNYASTVELALTACFRYAGQGYDTAAESSQIKRNIGAIVFGSDQGLVGRFNEVVVEYAVRTLKDLPGTVTKIWPLGERIHALLADSGQPTAGILTVPSSVNAITGLVGRILIDVEAARRYTSSTTIQGPEQSTNPWASDCCRWILHGRKNLLPSRGQRQCSRK